VTLLRILAPLSLAILVSSTPGCVLTGFVLTTVENPEARQVAIERLDRVTLTVGSEGRPSAHVLIRLEDRRLLHYAQDATGRFVVDDGPLPPSTARIVVATRCRSYRVHDEPSPVLAPGDPIWRADPIDGTLSGPVAATDEDMEAPVVLVSGFAHPNDLEVREASFAVSLLAPLADRGRTSRAFELDSFVARVVSLSIERREARLVPHLVVERVDGRREYLESSDLEALRPSTGVFPVSVVPVLVVRDLDALAIGSGVWRVGEDGSAASALSSYTESDRREAAVFEVRLDERSRRWRARFLAPLGEPLAAATRSGVVASSSEARSALGMARGVGLVLFLPIAVVVDFATFPIEAALLIALNHDSPLPW
jgi:hypothetical protein